MNYIDETATKIGALCGMSMEDKKERELLRIYALLALTKGTETCSDDVHDAWSAWTAEDRPEHPCLVPFEELSDEEKAKDYEYVDAIRKVVREMNDMEFYGEVALPDGSGCAVGSMPLPKGHWLTENGHEPPPMVMRCGAYHPRRWELRDKIEAAARYGIRATTSNGRVEDFDPDAMVNNIVIGFLGYFTDNGLNGVNDPSPVPPEVSRTGAAPERLNFKVRPKGTGIHVEIVNLDKIGDHSRSIHRMAEEIVAPLVHGKVDIRAIDEATLLLNEWSFRLECAGLRAVRHISHDRWTWEGPVVE